MSTELVLRKPNAILVMVPKSGKLTGVGRKVWNSLLFSSAKQQFAYRDQHGREPDNKHLYRARADEILDVVEVGESNLKSELRKHILALRRTEYDWEAPDAKTGIVWDNLAPLSQAKFEISNGCLYVLWALPPDINAALANPVQFPSTKLFLEKSALLKGYTAVALYEIVARYRNNYVKGGTGECLTCASPPEWWVNVLTNMSAKKDKETGEPVKREWRKVKSEHVNKAIEQINAVTDVEIEMREKKTGKAISLVQFVVRQKKAEPREIQQSHFAVIKQGIRLGLTEHQIEVAISQSSPAHVEICLAKLDARLQSKDKPPVDNIGRYFHSIVNEGAPVKIIDDEPEQPKSASAVESPSVTAAKSGQTILKEEFMALPEAQKRVFARLAVDSLTQKKLINSRLLSNAEQGVWSGVLLSEMISCYTEGREGQALEQ